MISGARSLPSHALSGIRSLEPQSVVCDRAGYEAGICEFLAFMPVTSPKMP